MTITSLLWKICAGLIVPQQCVLCDVPVVNSDLSPLCRPCLDELLPLPSRVCYFCGVVVPGNILDCDAVCSRCRTDPQPFDFARTWGSYSGPLRDLIRRFKFDGFQRLACPLAGILHSCLLDSGLEWEVDWIVPVPSHRKRKRQRGFDPTRLLAGVLSRDLEVPVFGGLTRQRDTLPQFGLDRKQRLRNVAGAFHLRHGERLAGKRVLLLDDVLTTGVTVCEISRLLKRKSSPSTILVLALARPCLRAGN